VFFYIFLRDYTFGKYFFNESKIRIYSLIICQLWIWKGDSDAALLPERRNGKPRFPECKTIFELGKNNFIFYGALLRISPPATSARSPHPELEFEN
jgi:hypothetical protein